MSSKGMEQPIFLEEDIYNRDIYEGLPEDPERLPTRGDLNIYSPSVVRSRIKVVTEEERVKAKQWARDQCIEQHIQLKKCFKESWFPICMDESKGFWDCIRDNKKRMETKEQIWRIGQEEKFLTRGLPMSDFTSGSSKSTDSKTKM